MRLLSIAEVCAGAIGTYPMISIVLSKEDELGSRQNWGNRYRNEIDKLVAAMADKRGKRQSTDIDNKLSCLLKLTDWIPSVGSVAVFHGPELSGYLKLPFCTGNSLFVSDRFHLAPLYQWFVLRDRFYLLTLGASDATLFRGSGLGLEKLAVIVTARPSKTGKESMKAFFEKLNTVSLQHLHGETAPLLLSGLEGPQDVFRKIAGYPYLEPQGLLIASQNLRWLHKESLAVVNRLVCQVEDSSLKELDLALRDKNATFEIEKIARAAVAGRIECLFIAEDQRISGSVDRNSGDIHSLESEKTSQDLLRQLAEITAEHRGRVVSVSAKRRPAISLPAATYRW